MRRSLGRIVAMLAVFIGVVVGGVAVAQRQPPYWASISSGQAMMRTGPGRTYPATWLYVRRDLPIRIVAVQDEWRRVQDPDGTEGWMLVSLLSDQRTAIVRGQGPQPMYENPDPATTIRYRAEPGVVGRISRCANGFCLFDVEGRRGYIRIQTLWGLDADEQIG